MEKRLYRSNDKKVIAGIAGGLGEYLDVDPVIIRIILVLITIFHGIGILIYIIMWIAVPENPNKKVFPDKSYSESTNLHENQKTDKDQKPLDFETLKETSSTGRIIFGIVLIFIGLIFLSERLIPFLDFEFVFSIKIT